MWLGPVEAVEVLYGVKEVRGMFGHGKFRDGQQEQEPKCASRESLETGKISLARFKSYKRILETLFEFGDQARR